MFNTLLFWCWILIMHPAFVVAFQCFGSFASESDLCVLSVVALLV